MNEKKQPEQQFVAVLIPANEVRVGDVLDRSRKSRVTQIVPRDRFVLFTVATLGARSNTVDTHGVTDRVLIYRPKEN